MDCHVILCESIVENVGGIRRVVTDDVNGRTLLDWVVVRALDPDERGD